MGVRNNLLFVTCHGECCEEGLSYALNLARLMNKEITILMVFRKSLKDRFDDVMTAVTFAEAGEHETALRHYALRNTPDHSPASYISLLEARCRDIGVPMNVQTTSRDIVSSVKDVIGRMKTIDMVLLSPSVVNHAAVTEKDLQRLVKTASRPIVTMTRQAAAPA